MEISLDPETGLRLLGPTPERAQEFFQLIDRNRTYLRQWLPWVDFMQAPQDTENRVRVLQKETAEGLSFALWIEEKGQLVGICHLTEINRSNKKASIGYWISEEARGRGLARKATLALMKFGFQEQGLNRIEIRCATGNLASQAVPKALGFQQEGILRENEWLYDRFLDHVVYSKLKKEHQEMI